MNKTSEYLLLIRGTEWSKGLSPEEIEKALGRFMAWFEGLQEQGKLKGANPLKSEGKVVSGANGRTVVDGPFAESKETVGGYFLLSLADIDEAVAIAKQCPILEYGALVEVRPVSEQCPIMEAAREAGALAHA